MFMLEKVLERWAAKFAPNGNGSAPSAGVGRAGAPADER
jgi:hypothetical protein